MLYVVHALSQNISISDEKRREFVLAYQEDETLSKMKFSYLTGLMEYRIILGLLHTGHLLGIEKTIIKARQNVYWPDMVKDITNFVNSFYNCQIFKRANCKELR